MAQHRICFVSSEVAPFAKTGGLADVSAALPLHLHRKKHDVRVVMPLYPRVESRAPDLAPVEALRDIPLRMGSRTYRVSGYAATLPGSDLPVLFVHCPALYAREGIYTQDADEHLRFLVLTRAAIEFCQRLAWAPDVFHVNDWQSAVLPLYLKTIYAWDRLFEGTRALMTIHNLGYQGVFPAAILPDMALGDSA